MKNKDVPAKESDITPRGVSHSIIPEEYLKKTQDRWDSENPLHKNKIIINALNQVIDARPNQDDSSS